MPCVGLGLGWEGREGELGGGGDKIGNSSGVVEGWWRMSKVGRYEMVDGKRSLGLLTLSLHE